MSSALLTPSQRIGGFSSRPPLAPPRPSGSPSVLPPRPSRPPLPGAPSSARPGSAEPGSTPRPGAIIETAPLSELTGIRTQLEEAKRALLVKEAETWTLIAQRDARIAEAEAARAATKDRAAELGELEALKAKMVEKDARIQELQEKLAKLEVELAAAHAGGGAPEDDLKQIRGIGPAFERELKRLGVRTFAQIAAWSDADIDGIAPKIKARPDRIRREGWVASAAERTAK
jgi:predicted flap endonuclease-1-like 5' DNA nuclease